MKIEMGESLIYSYLRHVKYCQLVQTNWKASPSWTISNKDMLIKIMNGVSNFYSEKYGISIFKKSSFDQLLRQAEADVVGICYNPEPFIYSVDVAFHENGLMYGNKSATAANVIKKYVRTIMCLIGYMNFFEGEVIFASPKVNKNVLDELLPLLDDLKKLLNSLEVNFSIKLFTNDSFYKSILSPIMLQSSDVSDTAELFLRSYQMIRLFEKPVKNKENGEEITASDTNEFMSIEALDELKIGKLVQITIGYMAEHDLLSNDTIAELLSKSYCKETFGINFALLKDVTDCNDIDIIRKDSKGYSRYYGTPVKYHGKSYLLCQEWNDRMHREKYDKWYKPLIGNVK